MTQPGDTERNAAMGRTPSIGQRSSAPAVASRVRVDVTDLQKMQRVLKDIETGATKVSKSLAGLGDAPQKAIKEANAELARLRTLIAGGGRGGTVSQSGGTRIANQHAGQITGTPTPAQPRAPQGMNVGQQVATRFGAGGTGSYLAGAVAIDAVAIAAKYGKEHLGDAIARSYTLNRALIQQGAPMTGYAQQGNLGVQLARGPFGKSSTGYADLTQGYATVYGTFGTGGRTGAAAVSGAAQLAALNPTLGVTGGAQSQAGMMNVSNYYRARLMGVNQSLRNGPNPKAFMDAVINRIEGQLGQPLSEEQIQSGYTPGTNLYLDLQGFGDDTRVQILTYWAMRNKSKQSRAVAMRAGSTVQQVARVSGGQGNLAYAKQQRGAATGALQAGLDQGGLQAYADAIGAQTTLIKASTAVLGPFAAGLGAATALLGTFSGALSLAMGGFAGGAVGRMFGGALGRGGKPGGFAGPLQYGAGSATSPAVPPLGGVVFGGSGRGLGRTLLTRGLRAGAYGAGGAAAGAAFDATGHSTLGNYASDIGTGAAIGSMIVPGVGTVIGAGVGAIGGAGKQLSGWTEKHHFAGTGTHFGKNTSPEFRDAWQQWTDSGMKGPPPDPRDYIGGYTPGAQGGATNVAVPGSTSGQYRSAASSSQSTVTAGAVIGTAEHYLGTPYRYGGSSPKTGFDCSGLTQFSYGQHGIRLPRTAHEQQGVGTDIAKDQIGPGDLIFFGSPAYHVGMSIGGGKMIESPHTGDVVKISSDRRGASSGVRRVLSNTSMEGAPGSTSTGQDGSSGGGRAANAFGGGGNFFTTTSLDVLMNALAGGSAAPSARMRTSSTTATSSGSDASAPAVHVKGGNAKQNEALAKRMAATYAWATGNEWGSLDWLWNQESGFLTSAGRTSAAYGIPQADPGSKMASAGPDWVSNPATQIKWGLSYIKSTYGSPSKAVAHKHATDSNTGSHAQFAQPGGWYDKGSWELIRDEIAQLHKGEMILPAKTAEKVRQAVAIPGGERSASSPHGRRQIPVTFAFTLMNGSEYEMRKAARRFVEYVEEDSDIELVSSR